MAVGDRIKRARNLRGMTQKELGIAIGFEEKSADIRIAQYESNTRTMCPACCPCRLASYHSSPAP